MNTTSITSNLMRHHSTICFFILLSTLAIHAENWEPLPDKTLGFIFGIDGPSLNLNIENKDNTRTINYSPNVPGRFRLGLGLGPLSASYGLPLRLEDKLLTNRGKTKLDDWQFRFARRQWYVEFFYQSYRGYYIENSKTADPSWISEPVKIQRPDIESSKLSLQAQYTLSPKNFHLSSPFGYGVRQKISGGSWFLQGSSSYNRIRADSPLVPSASSSVYGAFSEFTDGDLSDFKVGGGYGHIFVLSNWYLGASLGLGFGLERQQYTLPSQGYENMYRFGNSGHVKISTGYKGEHFFFTTNFFADTNSFIVENTKLENTTIEISILTGYRMSGVTLPVVDGVIEWLSSY